MSGIGSLFSETLSAAWRRVAAGAPFETLLPLVRPVAPYDRPSSLSPLAAVAAMLGIVAASGIALAAVAVLLVALLALAFLLSEVLGIRVELSPA